MTERPILFSGPMVRALFAGTKTQTRRALRQQPPEDHAPLSVETIFPTKTDKHGEQRPGPECFGVTAEDGEWCLPCPYGAPGDHLWVRETFLLRAAGKHAVYRADLDPVEAAGLGAMYGGWKPSIFMPRAWSRLVLGIAGVRVERLQDISYDDALAEGAMDGATFCEAMSPGEIGKFTGETAAETARRLRWPQRNYREIWERINGSSSWDANPWVWVINFECTNQELSK